MAKLYTVEVGPVIRLETGLTLTQATKVAIKAYSPSGSLSELVAVVNSTTKVQHTKTALTLATKGPWKLHAYAEFTGGVIYWGDEYVLTVY